MSVELSTRLNELMKEKGYSKYDMVDKTGYSYSTIVQYCKGSRYPSSARKEELAKLFDCDVDYLSGRTDVRKVDDLKNVVDTRISDKETRILSAFRNADTKTQTIILMLLNLF